MKWYDPRTWGKGKKGYEGADTNRFTMAWRSPSTAANVEVFNNLEKLRNRSRQLHRDNPWAKGARAQIVNNVIGRPGIIPQIQLDDATNKRIEDLYWRWAKAKNCDVRGQLSITGLQRLAISTWWESGEVLAKKVTGYRPGAQVDLKIEIIEPDLLDHTFNQDRDEKNPRIIQGIEVDGFGKPVAYHLFKKHPGEYQTGQTRERVRVTADKIIHFFVPTRAGQMRGIPELHAVMRRLHDIAGYEEAERIAARTAAAKMGFIYSENGDLPEDVDGEVKIDAQAGSIGVLPAGMKFEAWDPQHPTTAFDAFMLSMLRGIAAGVDMSYESVTRDFSRTSFSSARTAILPERDAYRVLQDYFAETFMARVFEWFIDAAHLGAFLPRPIPLYLTDREALIDSVKWQGRGWPWVDPLKDIQAKKEELRAGLTTYAEIFAENGKDFNEMMQRIKQERDAMAALGLTFDIGASPAAPQNNDEPKHAPAEDDEPAEEKWGFQ